MTALLRISLAIAALLAACALPVHDARALETGAVDVAAWQPVSDDELAGMRGGFLNLHGMLIDFSFLSRLEINGAVQQHFSFTSDILAQAAGGGQQIIPPAVLQNADNNAHIALQRVLDLNVVNAAAAAANRAQMQQLAFQNMLASR